MTLFLGLGALVSCKPSTKDSELQQTKSSNSYNASLSKLNTHDTLGYDFAKQQLTELFKGKGQPFTWDTLIRNPSTAVAMVEPLLFDIFGKKNILNERPYEVYLINGYWYLAGTIPKGWEGGAFEIIMSAKDGKIIRLTHYK